MTARHLAPGEVFFRDINLTPVRGTNLALASQSIAMLKQRSWEEVLLLTGADALMPLPGPGMKPHPKATSTLMDTLDVSAEDAARASALACLSITFSLPKKVATTSSASTSFLYPAPGSDIYKQVRSDIRASLGLPDVGGKALRYSPYDSDILGEREISNLLQQLSDTEVTADIFIAMVEALLSPPKSNGADRVCIALSDLPDALGIQNVAGGIPETLALAAASHAGRKPVVLDTGYLGIMVETAFLTGHPALSEPAAKNALAGSILKLPNIGMLLAAGSPLLRPLQKAKIVKAASTSEDLRTRLEATSFHLEDHPSKPEHTMVEVTPITTPFLPVTVLVTAPTAGDLMIGRLAFRPDNLSIGRLMKGGVELSEDLRENIGALAMVSEIRRHMHLAESASQSATHSFSSASFVSPYGGDVGRVAKVLSEGSARLLRSHVSVSNTEASASLRFSLFDDALLSEMDHAVREELSKRKGEIGEDLKRLHACLRHLDLVPEDLEVAFRRYVRGVIPKFVVDDMLFQIEHAPLYTQIGHMLDEGCRGLVWSEVGLNYEYVEAEATDDESVDELIPELSKIDLLRGHKRKRRLQYSYSLLALEFQDIEAAEAAYQ